MTGLPAVSKEPTKSNRMPKQSSTRVRAHAKTFNEGASDQRDIVIGKLKREIRKWSTIRTELPGNIVELTLRDLLAWVEASAERYNAKGGGLGREHLMHALKRTKGKA